jgi:protein involved in polysaccharide export with SLBB domain
MNENEILEVEMELGGGDKVQMKIQESDDWSEI